jgi:ABC-type enterochelin transport system permease subunit
MMVISYSQGQKHYPIPYVTKKLVAYIIISIILYLIYFGISSFTDNTWISLIAATLLLTVFIWFLGLVEKKELSKLPLIGKLYKTTATPAAAMPHVAPQSSDNMKA